MHRAVRILFHYPCPDGAFAALAAHLRFRHSPSVDVKWVPHSTFKRLEFENSPLFTPDTEVFLLDYVGPDGFIPALAPKTTKITLVDHHKTAADIIQTLTKNNQIPKNFEMHLEMEASGATLAHQFFTKDKGAPLIEDEKESQRVASLFSYIEDHDLWRHKLPFSKEFTSGFAALKLEFDPNKNANIFDQLLACDPQQLIESGKKLLAEEAAIIARELAASFEVKLGGGQYGTCLGIVTSYPELRSELGNQLAAKSKAARHRAIACVAYVETEAQPAASNEPMLKISLRSIGDEDTTVVSSAYKGGGHKNASSFMLPTEEFNRWKA